MSNVLKVQIAGQRYRYEVMQVVFDEDNDWLKDPKELTQGEQRDFLRFNDNRLDISDYEYFDHQDAGVAIRHNGDIYYELGNSKGKMPMENVLSALNHPILLAHQNAYVVRQPKSLLNNLFAILPSTKADAPNPIIKHPEQSPFLSGNQTLTVAIITL